MQRPLSHLGRAKPSLASPAPNEVSNCDADLIAVLEEKRREIDEEINTFKLQKEKEFKAFEDELRFRKRRNKDTGIPHSTSPILRLSSIDKKDLDANHSVAKEEDKKAADAVLKPTPGPSRPSISVDRLTVNGLTTPPITGTPPLGTNLFPSTTHLSGISPPATSWRESDKPATPSDRENEFHGLFTPAYLQLLESKPSSLPQNSTSPSIPQSKHGLTARMLPSNSLPSALRTASGTTRKRKHVTFRLAHAVVVDPSSSYEETPSPSEPDDKHFDNAKAHSGNEISPGSLPRGRSASYPTAGLTSPNLTENEASFFSFDEELDDNGDKPPNDLKVSGLSR